MPRTGTRDTTQTRLTLALISQLVRKDLKVKYQGSSLGFVWSLANPLLMLVVYTFVFQFVLKSGVPFFGFFLLSGLLIWNFFSMGVTGAATAVTANAGLVKKVPFPHSALPLAQVAFSGVQVALQFIVFFAALVIAGWGPWRPQLLLLPVALLVAVVLTVGLGLFVSATTVRLKDTQHILEILMFAWMWVTPIIYPPSLVHDLLGDRQWLYYLNPMAGVVVSFQRALYGQVYYPESGKMLLASDSNVFYVEVLGLGLLVAGAMFAIGVWQFHQRSQDFAEDL